MAKKNNKGLLIALAVGVGGFAAYKYMHRDGAPGVPGLPGLPPAPGLPPSGSTAPGAATNNGSNVSPNTNTGANTAAINPAVAATVQSWVVADNKPPSAALAMAKIPTEFNGMAAIISGGWNPTDDQRAFWNAIVNKYDPQRKYW